MSLHGQSLASSTGREGKMEGMFGQKRLPSTAGRSRRSLFRINAAKRVKKSDLEEVGAQDREPKDMALFE